MLVALAVVAVVGAVVAPQSGGVVSEAPPVRLPRDDVAGAVAAVLQLHADTLAAMQVGVAVVDDDGVVVADHAGGAALLPASTMKVATAMAVTDHLDPSSRLHTRVVAPGPPGQGGRVPHLRLLGAGDPTLTTRAFRRHVHPSRPATNLERLADRVVAAGVRRVTGDVVGDASLFGPSTLAPGWPDRYLDDYDARHVAGLTVDTGLAVDTRSVDGSEQLVGRAQATSPSLLAAWEFARALDERGVRIDGRVTTSGLAVDGVDAHEVARVASPPVGRLLRFMLEESDNHMADTLVRTAAARAEDVGTWSAAARTVAASLRGRGIPADGVVVDDGSGLSRLDRLTPVVLALADHAMSQQLGQTWDEWLSTAGVDGTFSLRLRGTAGEGRFAGKSGTLADVKAIVGHVTGPDGRRLHVAMVANEVSDGQAWRPALLGDDLTLALLDQLDGCRRQWRQPATPTPSAPGTDQPTSSASATPSPDPTPGPGLADAARWRRVCPQQ